MTDERSYPGARVPDRFRMHDANGVGIATYEWGKENNYPLFLVHGGNDFARTFDVFGPMLADAGYRVVTWDHRGHGNSDQTALYSWDADIRDALSVMSSVTDEPAPVVGHSKGGAIMLLLAEASPYRVKSLVNIDGMPAKKRMPDAPDHDQSRLMAEEITTWLRYRHEAATATRKPGTIEDLARRRGAMNPRLSKEWLEYLVAVGARKDEDGWRWKLDPTMRFVGFGPWRPEWSLLRMVSLSIPFLGLLGTVDEPMGWGVNERDVRPWLPRHGRLHVFEDIGHFLHIEQPREVADIVLEFIA